MSSVKLCYNLLKIFSFAEALIAQEKICSMSENSLNMFCEFPDILKCQIFSMKYRTLWKISNSAQQLRTRKFLPVCTKPAWRLMLWKCLFVAFMYKAKNSLWVFGVTLIWVNYVVLLGVVLKAKHHILSTVPQFFSQMILYTSCIMHTNPFRKLLLLLSNFASYGKSEARSEKQGVKNFIILYYICYFIISILFSEASEKK